MKFSNIIILGIVVVALAVAATLSPVRDTSSREDFQLLKIEYGLDAVKQADSETANSSSFNEWTLGIPEVSQKEPDVVEKIKREPTKKLPAILEKTIISLLEEEGFTPVAKPQEVQHGLMLTIYESRKK